MRRTRLAAGTAVLAAALGPACTPDIATDVLPEVLEFDPGKSPPRVSEPTFALINPATGKIDLSVAGIVTPADCHNQTAMPEAQCEFNQYLQSLDGFPTVALARTPVSAAYDPATATVPQNVAVIEVQAAGPKLDTEARVEFDAAGGYMQVKPKRTWPSASFVWIGVRGYDNGLHTGGTNPLPFVASVPYNLLKRDDSLLCGQPAAAVAATNCGYFALLAQQMAPEAARASLVQLETLRVAMIGLQGWTLLAGVGGMPKAEAAILWGFPVHKAPVIELSPPLLVPAVVGADEIHLAVNGALDPATVKAFRPAQETGSVYLLDTTELNKMNLRAGFPDMTATLVGDSISIKAAAPLVLGDDYAIIVSTAAKSPAGTSLVASPVVALLKAHGVISSGGQSQVSSLTAAEAAQLEESRLKLIPLLDNTTLGALTSLGRDNIAYVFGFKAGAQ